MANGAEQQRVRKGRWQCAVGVFVSWRDERQQWCQMLSWGGGGQDGPKNWKKTLRMHGFDGLVELQQRQTQPHTPDHTHTHTISNEHSTLVTVVCHFSLPAGQSRLKNSAAKGYCKTHRHAQTHTHKHLNKLIHTHTMYARVPLQTTISQESTVSKPPFKLDSFRDRS